MTQRTADAVFDGGDRHVVGDGFPVHTFFPRPGLDDEISPFLLLDYAGPHDFPPASTPRGVGAHPHRGFETVTIVYQGEVEHRDSAGNSGWLGPGDVQWMTAASGVVHEEKHSRAFAERGGTLEMIQLWVNLPAAAKMMPPRYQDIRGRDIPSVDVAGLFRASGEGAARTSVGREGGTVRVIAGALGHKLGPAKTVTAMQLFDVTVERGARIELPVVGGFNAAVLLLHGRAAVAGTHVAGRHIVRLSRDGDGVEIEALEASSLLLMAGEPIRESVARHGPFVMNTEQELRTAFDDYRHGRMGRL